SIYAEDKYTAVIETNYFNVVWSDYIGAGWGSDLYAPEVVEAGAWDWDNLVGTGPWMVKEYIPGSVFAYERNPIFYDTTTINGVEYEIPFADELLIPIIIDESTRIAALRTGVIDYMGGEISQVPLWYEDTLRRTCPDLKIERLAGSQCNFIQFIQEITGRVHPLVSDRDIRRALMIGLDREAIATAVWLKADTHSFPVSSLAPGFTPFDELPASAQELFTYDPDLARQMLTDAGYPEGFTLIIAAEAEDTIWVDTLTMVKDQWAKIGVTADLRLMEKAACFAFKEVEEGEVPHYHAW
ncbi:unnamed protein product, partial [marine sediment metagenome]